MNSLSQYDTGIYKIVNKINGKVYVGQSVNMRNRYARHLNSLRKNKHYNQYLQRSFNKYKEESFYAEVLEFCKPEKLNHKERYWIKRLKSEYKDYGYNAPYAYKIFDEYGISIGTMLLFSFICITLYILFILLVIVSAIFRILYIQYCWIFSFMIIYTKLI